MAYLLEELPAGEVELWELRVSLHELVRSSNAVEEGDRQRHGLTDHAHEDGTRQTVPVDSGCL